MRILFFVAILFWAQLSYALTDEEYLRLLHESALFRKENTSLMDQWLGMKKTMDKAKWPTIIHDQQAWLAKGRDDAARKNMAQGYTREYAYAKATHDRTAYLWSLEENSKLTPEELAKGEGVEPAEYDEPAGPIYGAYDGQTMGKISRIIPTSGDLSQVQVVDSYGHTHNYYISRKEIAEKTKKFQESQDASFSDCSYPEPSEGEKPYIFEILREQPVTAGARELGEKGQLIRIIGNFSQCYN